MRDLSYGEKIAQDAYIRKLARRNESIGKTSKTKTQPSEPELHLYPVIDINNPITGLNWDSIAGYAAGVADTFNDNTHKFTILRMPTGRGKTSTAVKTLSLLEKQPTFVIVAPKAVVQGGGWQRTIAAWNIDHPEQQLHPLMIESHDRFANILKHPKSFMKLIKLLGHQGIVIIDEVHAYKTPTSKRAKMLQKLKGLRKIGLTATPFTNDAIHDGISYLVTAGLYTSKTNFYNESGLWRLLDQYGRPQVYTNNHVNPIIWPFYNTMQEQLSRIVYTPEIDETQVNMPNVHTHVVQLDFDQALTDNIESVVKAYKRGAFESALDFAMALVTTIGRSQVRLDMLHKIITQKWVKQPLVFYWNNSVRETLIEYLTAKGFKPQIIAGDTSAAYIDHASNQPIIVQYQAGAEGVEFKNSNVTVFYQNQSSASKLEQAKGRNVRRGMEHAVHQYSLVNPVHFDIMLYDRLEQRMEVSKKMLEELALLTLKEIK